MPLTESPAPHSSIDPAKGRFPVSALGRRGPVAHPTRMLAWAEPIKIPGC